MDCLPFQSGHFFGTRWQFFRIQGKKILQGANGRRSRFTVRLAVGEYESCRIGLRGDFQATMFKQPDRFVYATCDGPSFTLVGGLERPLVGATCISKSKPITVGRDIVFQTSHKLPPRQNDIGQTSLRNNACLTTQIILPIRAFDQRYEAHTSPMPCQICVRLGFGRIEKGLTTRRRKSLSLFKYRRRDLNPHSLYGYWILSPARLPFRHSGLVITLQ